MNPAKPDARTRRAPGRSCRRKGKWPRRLHRRRTLGGIARRRLGAALEVAGFDGWSLRSPAKTTLETRQGWESTSEARTHFPMIGRILGGFSRHWKISGPFFQALEKRDSGQAARSSGVQPEQSGALSKLCGRADRTACALSWLAAAAGGGIGAVGEWSPSVRSLFLFARAPENEDEKTGGPASLRESGAMPGQERTGRREPPSSRERQPGQPASARRSGGPTGDRAHAGDGSAGTRLPRRSNAKAGPACRASTGAAQRRPCQARRPAGRGVCSKARRRALRGGEERERRAGGSKNRDASGGAVLAYVPSGAPAPRGGGLRVKGRD